MAAFLDIFGFLSVLLRGLSFAFEALTLGGLVFIHTVAGPFAPTNAASRSRRRWLVCASTLLALTQISMVAANSAILVGSTDLRISDLYGAGFWTAGALTVGGAVIIASFSSTRWLGVVSPLAAVCILAGSVMTSHSVGRIEHRWLLAGVTLVHHAAGAAWIGGLPYLLVTLRHTRNGAAAAITARFSSLAMLSVALLSAAGAVLTFAYVGSAGAAAGTAYGAMLAAKVFLTGTVLGLGFLNLKIVRAVRGGGQPSTLPSMLPLRRFAEAEVGIGFTILLAAASLTSTPPAADILANRVTPAEIVARMKPRWPRLNTPQVSQLSPPSPLNERGASVLPGSFIPGQSFRASSPADIAWSEYNHHWAGLIVLATGLLALLSRRWRGARHWPLIFLGLAVFLLIRADPENWPLGPRGFWESFQVAEVAQHRIFVVLIAGFAAFEWAVQNRRLAAKSAGLVFPLVCASGGALLLTHSHSLGNVKEEFLAELSHIPLAIFGVIAGWSRWLEIRAAGHRSRDYSRVTGWIWPACLVLIGAVLMLYRES